MVVEGDQFCWLPGEAEEVVEGIEETEGDNVPTAGVVVRIPGHALSTTIDLE